jgi:carboxypeptidase Taq
MKTIELKVKRVEESELAQNYERLMSKYRDLVILRSVNAIMEWDTETKMPPGAFSLRSHQLALLGTLDQKMAADHEIGTLLNAIQNHIDYASMGEVQRRNVYLIKRNYDDNVKLPERLVSETAKQKVLAYESWKKAKAAKDFSMFLPELAKMFDLRKQAAEILMETKGVTNLYDAMIDDFEPHVRQDLITATFEQLRRGIMPIVGKIISIAGEPDTYLLKRRVPQGVQEEIAKSAARYIGYDIDSKGARGRIDETEHPFTNGYYDDVRITTHYMEGDFTSSLFSVLHEGGHAMYEQSLRPEWIFQPVGAACSYGIHESQSRFVENIVGRSREFWAYFLHQLKRIAGDSLSDLTLDSNFMRALNVVKPSKIRIQADEVTYALHIIIRFEIERDLFAEKISVRELPQVWNQKYRDYLGVEIKNDSEGVMQDVHWSHGSFGYFPSYALGDVFRGQMLSKMEGDMPDWREKISRGSFSEIRGWLTKNVHSYGNLYNPIDLMVKVCGESINPKPFIKYIDSRYAEIYGY